jgi:hypothetical protein
MMATSSSSSSNNNNNSNNSNAVVLADDALVASILSFLPKKSFRFTAAVNRRFQNQYRQLHRHGTTVTSFQSCVYTRAAAEIWIAETTNTSAAQACYIAARNGRGEVLQVLQERGFKWDSQTCAAVAGGGHFSLLQWMRTPNKQWGQCPWDEYTCAKAARNGHLHILQWARANGCDWNASTCNWAAGEGHLHVLQWARANGCDWSTETCANAADGGHLHIVQWVRNNGCDWDEETCWRATLYGHLDILQWATANGCPCNAIGCAMYARSLGHVAILDWLETANIPDIVDDDDHRYDSD